MSFLKRFTILFFLSLSLVVLGPVLAATCDMSDCGADDECTRRINECLELEELYTSANQKNKDELVDLKNRLNSIKAAINGVEEEMAELKESITDREEGLSYQEDVFFSRVRSFYKRSYQQSPFLLLLSSSNASELTRDLSYWRAATDEDKKIIIKVSQELLKLKNDKEELEEKKDWLAKTQVEVDRAAKFLDQEVAKTETYLGEIKGKIAQLTAKQQAILAEKTGTFQTTVGDVPLADDPASRPDYNPGFSPAFAAFSFGAPHFKGMSQYGAYGRAKSGQSAEVILKAYYGEGIEIKKDYSTSININVDGYGSVDIETYAKRIYEVPNSWGDDGGMEALKAQAVAARSYALARTNNGAGSICATESCQVYKPANKGGHWEEAVNATRGWVLVANGQPFSAWYASTSGGYQESYSHNGHATPGFWDTPSGRGGWTSQAYEKVAGSPWFYKGWYKNRAGDNCGRSHPWLTSEEMADILNAWVVLVKHGQGDDRVTPIGGCWSGNPYSIQELRAKAASLSVGYSSVNNVSETNYSSNGVTANVTLQTNQESVTIGGLDFKKVFNLRAPGRIALKSGLFNIEKK